MQQVHRRPCSYGRTVRLGPSVTEVSTSHFSRHMFQNARALPSRRGCSGWGYEDLVLHCCIVAKHLTWSNTRIPRFRMVLRTRFHCLFYLFFRFRPGAMLRQRPLVQSVSRRTKMLSQQLQSLLLPGVLVALALIGLGLLRSELRTPGIGLVRKKKKGRLFKFFTSKDTDKDKLRKAS